MHKSQSRSFLVVVAALLAGLLSACGTPAPSSACAAPPSCPACPACAVAGSAPSPQPAARPLQAARWSDLPGWNDDDLAAAWPAFLQSCRALAKRPQWPQWQAVCDEARSLNEPV